MIRSVGRGFKSNRVQKFFSFSVWTHFLSKATAQKVLFGLFVQHFNIPHSNRYIYLYEMNRIFLFSLQEVDTALLKLYADTNSAYLLDLVASENHCAVEESEQSLRKHQVTP